MKPKPPTWKELAPLFDKEKTGTLTLAEAEVIQRSKYSRFSIRSRPDGKWEETVLTPQQLVDHVAERYAKRKA